MLILVLLGIYFDAVVVFFTKSSLFFRLAVAILWARQFFFRDLLTFSAELRKDFVRFLEKMGTR